MIDGLAQAVPARPIGLVMHATVQSPVPLSVVVPCFNEEAVLPELVRRLVQVCDGAAPTGYEIVLVNDGSRDRTWELMAAAAQAHPQIVAVDLSRNHGHQLALTAGLSLARGERIFIIDADLQDPPELLPEMMARMDAGADVVFGQRRSRDGESLLKKATAGLFYRLLARASKVEIPVDTGDFRLMRRRVLEVFLAMPEAYRFVRGMVAWAGFRQEAFLYDRAPRFAGETKYPLRKMVSFAADALTGFSTAPLRLAFQLSMACLALAFAVGAYTVYSWLWLDTVRGWASLLVIFLFFSAAQLLCLSIIGEYVGRTYMQTKQRPLFVVREVLSSPDVAVGDPGPAAPEHGILP